MILHALNNYYSRMRDDSGVDIPPPGFCRQAIHFCLTLDKSGQLAGAPMDLRKDKEAKYLIVPLAVKKTSKIAANFMWDNTGYVLGADDKEKSGKTKEKFSAFKTLQHEVGGQIQDEGMHALLRFLDTWDPRNSPDLPFWEEMAGRNIVFRLDGDLAYLHERPAIREAWLMNFRAVDEADAGMCLVTGEPSVPISRLHASIKGVPGTQVAGAALISFNLPAFTSYGKTQNHNAPIGKYAAFAYTTALNHLLSRESRQKVRIADAVTVFWTQKASVAESLLAGLFDPSLMEDVPDQLQNDLRILLENVAQGKLPHQFDQPDNLFYILGLSPNAARISVRFWHVGTVSEILMRIGRHYNDMSIVKSFEREPDNPSPWQILKETAAQRDSRNIAPLLGGHLMQSVLTGAAYPRTILTALVGRIRADKQVNYIRASMLKAYLIRNHKMEVNMSLDITSTEPSYRLGRLFAVLEKAQEEGVKGAGATIKDRYFGAASATPGRIFPVLLRGVQNNIAKLRKGDATSGRAIYFDRLISEIVDGIDRFQPTLRLEEQGLFTIGYYHQRKEFFTKKSTIETREE